MKRYNNNYYYNKYTPKPIRTNYDRIHAIPTKPLNLIRNWYGRTDYNDTPRSTNRYREYNNERKTSEADREGIRYQYNQQKRNYDNNTYTTPYSTRKENFRYAPIMKNTTPEQKQKEKEEIQNQKQRHNQ